MKPVISVDNISKDFALAEEKHNTIFEKLFKKNGNKKKFSALKNITFDINNGDIVGIIGPNGSGKSTLLKIIAGILEPSKGTVSINTEGKIVSLLELGIGFHGELTAEENVFLYGSIIGMSEKELKKRLDDIIEFAELKNFKNVKLKNFSSGMQMRLAFSIAIQTNPEIMLIDEVLAVGDMHFQQKCFDFFDSFKKLKKTIILVTHDLDTVKRFCDKAYLMVKGEMVKKGSPEKVINEYIKEK